MRLGVILPVHGPLIADGGITAMATAAENAGADGLWVGDHIVMREPAIGYPFNASGVYPVPTDTDYFESLTLCAMIAAVTTRARVGTAVMVLPQRNVLQLAKTATTIDAVSGGRFVLGVGAGWFAGEMEALGYDFATRGRRMDEMLTLLADAWGGRPAAFDGEQVQVPEGVILFPRPGRLPIIVGGLTKVALRRAAHSDGWMGLGYVDRFDRPRLVTELEQLAEARRAAGTEGADFETILKLTCSPDRAAELPDRLAELIDLPYDEIIVEVPWRLGAPAAVSTIEAARTAIR
ncbi:MAG: TIGR03619 family F420-dependent LLM class oxidoreductase [Actinomycetota bacterium]